MKGGIYSAESCSQCGAKMAWNKDLWIVSCPTHLDQRPVKGYKVRIKVKGKTVNRNFPSYEEAEAYLIAVNYQVANGEFDSRVHIPSEAPKFGTLAFQWLESLEKRGMSSSYQRACTRIVRTAMVPWGKLTIGEITDSMIEEFIFGLVNEKTGEPLSSKSVDHINQNFKTFWKWLVEQRHIGLHEMPRFPKTKGESKMWDVLSSHAQGQILKKIYDNTFHRNPKVYLLFLILATCPKVRPGELLKVTHGDINLEIGRIYIKKGKEGKPKYIPIQDEDVPLIGALLRKYPASDDTRFFRSVPGEARVKPDTPFGWTRCYRNWKKAARSLGIENVPPYPGTKHTTATSIRSDHSYEDTRVATGHSTNRNFERYIRTDDDMLREMYASSRSKMGLDPVTISE